MGEQGPLDEIATARRVGISVDTLRRLIAEREFPPGIAVSGRVKVWLPMDVDAYLHLKSRISDPSVRRTEGDPGRTEGD